MKDVNIEAIDATTDDILSSMESEPDDDLSVEEENKLQQARKHRLDDILEEKRLRDELDDYKNYFSDTDDLYDNYADIGGRWHN